MFSVTGLVYVTSSVQVSATLRSTERDFGAQPDFDFLAVQRRLHQDEVAKLVMEIIVLREALVAAGVEPPETTGDDLLKLWRSCQVVVDAASKLVSTLGTSAELLRPFK